MKRLVTLGTDDPVVGEHYMVPCFNGVPVITPPHDDVEFFGFTRSHCHLDARFLTFRELTVYFDGDRQYDRLVRFGNTDALNQYIVDYVGQTAPTAKFYTLMRQRLSAYGFHEMPRQCLRLLPNRSEPRGDERTLAMQQFVGTVTIDRDGCRRCPHKGALLVGSATRCPAHGLKIHSDGKVCL